MRFSIFLIISTLFGCSSGSEKTSNLADTAKSLAVTDRKLELEEGQEVDFRQEFISLYQKPVIIDTFVINHGKKYAIIFRHLSAMDKGLVVPAKYNFDTNKDFTTHNFVSDLTVLSDKDTVFKKFINKAVFNSLLDTHDTSLKKYATLLYPTLTLNNDSIQIHYSISIPVTDVGIGVVIKFDKKGNYVIE